MNVEETRNEKPALKQVYVALQTSEDLSYKGAVTNLYPGKLCTRTDLIMKDK